MKYSKIRVIAAFLLSVVIAFVVASIAHTQFVLHELTMLSVDIPFSIRVETTMSDLIGLLPGYGPIILVGLLLGFGIIGTLRRFFEWPAITSFAVGGALSFAAIHLLMYPIFYITLIAGARGPWGFSAQCLAGVIGGLVFAKLLMWTRVADFRRH